MSVLCRVMSDRPIEVDLSPSKGYDVTEPRADATNHRFRVSKVIESGTSNLE